MTSENLELLQRDNIIYKKDDTEAAYIEYRNLKQDAKGKETLVVKGKFLTGYLNRRIVWGTQVINDTAENAMRTLVNSNCIAPTDNNRIIPNLILGNLNNFTQTVNYQVSYANLGDELESLCNTNGLGHRVSFDVTNRKLIFEVYEGLDRSISQSVNPRAIFSKEFENVLEQEYIDSLNNYRNLALIGGIGEGTSRKFVTIGSSAELDRFELFVDQKDLSNEITDSEGNTTTLTDTDYNNLLIGKGNEALAEAKEIQTFDSKINSNSNLIYKTDFDLGDIVTCINKRWGLILNTRITEIQEVYEKETQINITFGNNIPSLIDKIRRLR